MQRGLAPILIVVLVAIFGIGGYFVYNNYSNNRIRPAQYVQNTPAPSTTPTISSKDVLKVSNLISFDLPKGWMSKVINVKYTAQPYEILQLLSPDMVDNCCGGPKTNAVSISLQVTKDGKTNTLDKKYKQIYDVIHDPHPIAATDHDLTKTTIAGYPAISYFYDFEGHSHTYDVQMSNYLWAIKIWAPTAIQEEKHKSEINQFLSSLKFIQ